MMKPKTLYNRRLIAWFLTLALLTMGLPSDASWQCLNGKPCPQNCPMLRPCDHAPQACTASNSAHCAKCHPTPAAESCTATVAVCPHSQCVLRVQSKPNAALTQKIAISLPLLALPPPVTAVPSASVEALPVTTAPSLVLYPRRFLRPCLGRAPPELL